MLDVVGIVDIDGDGVCEKDGVFLKIFYQILINVVCQDFQVLIKVWWVEIGIEIELCNINVFVFFGGDSGFFDIFQKFYVDVQMYVNIFNGIDFQVYLGNGFCDKVLKFEFQWQGENIFCFCMLVYDELYVQLIIIVGIDECVKIGKQLNDMFVFNGGMILLVQCGCVFVYVNIFGGVVLNVWDFELWNVVDWYCIK